MTDYYAPASWQGIAERDGYAVVVDVSAGNRWVLDRSGGFDTSVSTAGSECPRCSGSGEEPDGWTLVSAKADPRTFHLDRLKREGSQAVPLLPDVVSPVYFNLDGREKCIRCHGRGQMPATETVHVDWPTFQANPKNRLWHVEHSGKILESGVGLGPCADYDKARAFAAVNRIVDRIEATVRRREGSHAPAAATTNKGEVTIRRNLQRDGIEVIFAEKPGEEIRRGLGNKSRGGLGFRWSRRQGLWYARYAPALWREVHRLLGVEDEDGDPAVVRASGDTDEEEDDVEPEHPLLDHAVACLTAPQHAESCSVDMDGVTWTRHHYDDCRDVAWKTEIEGRYTCTVRGDYSGFNRGNAPFWHVLYVDTSGQHPEPSSWNGQGGVLAGIDDGDSDPPTELLAAATELLNLGYPQDIVVDGITWECESGAAGDRIRYTAERNPWYRYTLIGRPGDWNARWMKPGDLSTTRCFTDEAHAELEGERDPLVILETLTRYIRNGLPPRIASSTVDLIPHEASGWDYHRVVPDEPDPQSHDAAAPSPSRPRSTSIELGQETVHQFTMF